MKLTPVTGLNILSLPKTSRGGLKMPEIPFPSPKFQNSTEHFPGPPGPPSDLCLRRYASSYQHGFSFPVSLDPPLA